MSSPSKWALDGIFLTNHEKVMPWSSYSWLFSYPKIEIFASWWFLSHACRIMIKTWSNDDCVLKIRCWLKILTFDCKMTILPLKLIVDQMRLLTMQIGTVSLETWHVDAWQCTWAHVTWFSPWKPQLPCKNQNPNLTGLGGCLNCATLE